jgi:hypothetical protein
MAGLTEIKMQKRVNENRSAKGGWLANEEKLVVP